MKVLVALMLYDYGKKERGYSYEYYNVYLPLKDKFGDQVLIYDYHSAYLQAGLGAMNRQLAGMIRSEKPDVTVFCLYKEQFEDGYLAEYRKHTSTVAYFIDDEWRQGFVKRYVAHFDHFTTRDYYMYRAYLSQGLTRVIHCPLGFNKNLYQKRDLPLKYDVSFVGGISPERRWIINYLNKQGIKVHVFGRGWGGGKDWVSQEQMVDIFNQSRINLNLTNSKLYDIRFLISLLKTPWILNSIRKSPKNKEGLKGRLYEICGCGGFQLSFYVRGLNLEYEIDREIVVYENIDSIADYVRFYLENENLRAQVADRAYQRSLRDHSAQEYLANMVKAATRP